MAEAPVPSLSLPGLRPFVEQQPWEQGFARRFDAAVVPQLGLLELARLRRRRQILLCRLAGLFCACLALALLWAGIEFDMPELLLEVCGGVVIACGLLAYYLPVRQVQELRQAYRDQVAGLLLPVALDFVGGIAHQRKAEPEKVAALAEFERLGLLPFANRWAVDDLLTGADQGLAWEMAEITATERRATRRGHRDRVIYRGVVTRLRRPGKERQPLLLLSPRLREPPAAPAGTQRLVPEQSALSGRAIAWAADADALGRCIPPACEAALAQWIDTLQGPFALAFAGENLDLLLPSAQDHFTGGDLVRPVAEIEADLHRLLAQVTWPRRLVAALQPAGTLAA